MWDFVNPDKCGGSIAKDFVIYFHALIHSESFAMSGSYPILIMMSQ